MTLSELTKRILFAVPAAIILIWLLWTGGVWFEATAGLLAGITIWECLRMADKSGARAYSAFSWVIALLLFTSFALPVEFVAGWVFILLFLTAWFLISKNEERFRRWSSTLFCGMYAPFGFAMLVQIRELGMGTDGFWLAFVLLLMIWGNDVFAYFGGKRFGKRKLAPSISPNKTWEGFWSGFIGAIAGLSIAYAIADPFPVSFLIMLPAAVLVSIFGPLGDLTESRLKRIAGVKDSSSIMPGHGGVFDRFDALILTAPFLFFYFYLVI